MAGFGVSVPVATAAAAERPIAQLVATTARSLNYVSSDPATEGKRPGLSACTGDSGAPVFGEVNGRFTVIGVLVSWSANASAGCGGITGVTPLAKYRGWIVEQAAKMGSALIRKDEPHGRVPEGNNRGHPLLPRRGIRELRRRRLRKRHWLILSKSLECCDSAYQGIQRGRPSLTGDRFDRTACLARSSSPLRSTTHFGYLRIWRLPRKQAHFCGVL